MTESKKDKKILQMLIDGNTIRNIAEDLKVGHTRIQAIRTANIDMIPKKVKTARTRSKNQNITQSTPEKTNEFLSYFKDRRPNRQANPMIAQRPRITPEEKEHLRECLIAGNHQRSFSRDMMKKALLILDKI